MFPKSMFPMSIIIIRFGEVLDGGEVPQVAGVVAARRADDLLLIVIVIVIIVNNNISITTTTTNNDNTTTTTNNNYNNTKLQRQVRVGQVHVGAWPIYIYIYIIIIIIIIIYIYIYIYISIYLYIVQIWYYIHNVCTNYDLQNMIHIITTCIIMYMICM